MRFDPISVDTSQLFFDPNNYRFLDLPDYKPVDKARAHEGIVQEQAYRRLRETPEFEVEPLKASILANGFVRLERIVVQKYSDEPQAWLVTEGNRRLAAIRWLLEDHESAVCNLSEAQISQLRTLDCLSLDPAAEGNENSTHILMAIRHVSGVKQWAAYQQARLIVQMVDNLGFAFQEVSNRISLTVREVIRRYRASKALGQMEDDEEFQDAARPELYAFFHEAVGQPVVRDWLGWNEDTYSFENDENRTHFYEWLTPRQVNGEQQPPKIQSALTHVRQLKTILQDRKALQMLLDPERPFEDAYVAAQQSAAAGETLRDFDQVLEDAIQFIDNLPAVTLKQLTDEQIELLTSLKEKAEEAVRNALKLRK